MANSPNIRHLQVVFEAIRTGSVSGAARALHMTQPAATQALESIEKYAGALLFRRSPLGLTPTPAGTLLGVRIERALDMLRAALTEAMAREDRTVGPGARLRGISSTRLMLLAATVERGSFAAAGLAAGVTRPSVHRGIRELEARLGVPLFERTSFGLQPTRAALRLASVARLAFGEVAQGRSEAAATIGSGAGCTVIGAMPLARSSLVPNAILKFAQAHPRHAVTILDGPYETLLAALRRGAADCLIGAERDPSPGADVTQEWLFDEPLAIIMRAQHPLAGRLRLQPRDLRRFAWIAPRPESPLRRHFESLFRNARPAASAAPIECNSLDAARVLLLGSNRLMLLSEQQVRYERLAGDLVALPLAQRPMRRRIALTMRTRWRPTPEQAILLELLRSEAAANRAEH